MTTVELGKKLEQLIGPRNIRKFALSMGMKPETIRKYVKEGTCPPLDTALCIANTLEVPLDWLADDLAEMPPPPASTLLEVAMAEAYRKLDIGRQADELARVRAMISAADPDVKRSPLSYLSPTELAKKTAELAKPPEDSPSPLTEGAVRAILEAEKFGRKSRQGKAPGQSSRRRKAAGE